MPFDWSEFLALARDVQRRAGAGYSEEASNRTAVSRAYYAAFGCVRTFAESGLGFQSHGTAADHTRLINYLQGDRRWISLANILRRLRGWRNQCDYDPDVPGLQVLVTIALQDAEDVLQQIPSSLQTGGVA